MSPLVAVLLKSVVLPAVLAGGALLGVGGFPEALRSRLQAAIIAVAFVLGAYLLIGRLSLPPMDGIESMSYAALLLAVFVAISPKDVSARYGLRALFVLLLGALLLYHIRASLTTHAGMRNMLAFYCLALGVWSILERSARQVGLPALILLPLIAATGTSAMLLLSASASFAQMVGVLCGVLGAVLALALIWPQRISVYGVLPFLSVFIVLFMASGHFYLNVNPWHMVFLCWPFALIWGRMWLPVPKNPIAEALVLGLLAGVGGYLVLF